MLARRVDAVGLQQLHHAQRRARHKARLAVHQPSGVHRMEAIHVLVRVDQPQHARLVQMPRQRQLHQDAVDRRVRIEPLHRLLERLLRAVFLQADYSGADAGLDAAVFLVAHVHLARRVLAHQNNRQMRRHALRDHRLCALRNLFLKCLCNRTAVDQRRRHGHSSSLCLNISAPSSATPTALSPESSGLAKQRRQSSLRFFARAVSISRSSRDEATPPASSA